MANRHGMPIWYELIVPDPDAAETFYGSVMGWTFFRPQGGLERDYRPFDAPDGKGVGGLMKMDAGKMPPAWMTYIGVDDVDAAAEKVKRLGGGVHIEPTDIPGVGRFAFVNDPQGALFYLMRGNSDEDSTAFGPTATSHCSWNELVTSDQTAALEFYGALFGWEKAGAMPMGEMGDYTFFKSGETRLGAMMNAPDKAAKPYWNFAFTVADIDAAKAAIEDGGGTIRLGPVELPENSGWLIQATDPQGATVMFTGPRA